MEIAPSPNATGAPDSSVASVTTSTIMPCVVGVTGSAAAAALARRGGSRLHVGGNVERLRASRRQARDVDRILQRQQAKADGYRRVRDPQPRAPHRVRHPAVI